MCLYIEEQKKAIIKKTYAFNVIDDKNTFLVNCYQYGDIFVMN